MTETLTHHFHRHPGAQHDGRGRAASVVKADGAQTGAGDCLAPPPGDRLGMGWLPNTWALRKPSTFARECAIWRAVTMLSAEMV
jgi:hypothetical protein